MGFQVKWYSVLRVCPGQPGVRGLLQASYGARIVLDSSMVEHAAVNRGVVGSSPTRGVKVNNLIQDL